MYPALAVMWRGVNPPADSMIGQARYSRKYICMPYQEIGVTIECRTDDNQSSIYTDTIIKTK